MTGRLRKSVTIGACLVFIVMDRRADFYNNYILDNTMHTKKNTMVLLLFFRPISTFILTFQKCLYVLNYVKNTAKIFLLTYYQQDSLIINNAHPCLHCKGVKIQVIL
jgi:hypothetical protein